ncbi:MAG: hypothetical protein AA908_07885 [Chlorobi bacterium NICIL-2]|nr:MAG: hypothetical protein AA908_07885 [Chlorobi bacterium NICIL-2]
MTSLQHFRRLFEYEQWCVPRIRVSLESISPAAHADDRYQRALTLVGHIAAAQLLWLWRIAGGTAPATPFPEISTTEHAIAMLGEGIARWQDYLSRCSEEDLAQVVQYRTTTGAPYENTIEEILTQVLLHGAYHRGQIALLVRQLGGQPAVTDFIAWVRS